MSVNAKETTLALLTLHAGLNDATRGSLCCQLSHIPL